MIHELPPLLNILLLNLTASLATGWDGALAVLRQPGKRSYRFLVGIDAGIMICPSFLRFVDQARELSGPRTGTRGFGAGATFIYLMDLFSPHIRFGETELRGRPQAPEPQGSSRRERGSRRLRGFHILHGRGRYARSVARPL
jgi:zinc transporter ZupT